MCLCRDRERAREGEVGEKEGEQRVNGFLSVISDELRSTWDLLYGKRKKKKRVIVGLMV